MYEFISPSAARARYDELLQEAEQERFALRVLQAQGPSWTKQVLWHLSQYLIATGNRLKAYSEMSPSLG